MSYQHILQRKGKKKREKRKGMQLINSANLF